MALKQAAAAVLPREVPEPPRRIEIDGDGSACRPVLSAEDLSCMREELEKDQAAREVARGLSREVSAMCSEAVIALQYGRPEAADVAIDEARRRLDKQEAENPHEVGNRDNSFQQACESYVKAAGLRWFLQIGRVLPRASLGLGFDDEEYLIGMIGVCQELEHYALRRATLKDARSVGLCQRFVTDMKAELLGFNFRNGPLRKKFDGVKYAERRCENLLYELSLVGLIDEVGMAEEEAQKRRLQDTPQVEEEGEKAITGSVPIEDKGSDGGGAKAAYASACRLDQEEWEQLRAAYTLYDDKRELVIKGCRDVQKAAKQSIFASQRGDARQASKLITTANKGIMAIWEAHVRDNPGLRWGAFTHAVEELAEAELFFAWLEAEDGGDITNLEGSETQDALRTLLPRRAKLAGGLINAAEFLGAVSDYTGEVGRVAVEAATRRDGATVKRCLAAVIACHSALAKMPLFGRQTDKLTNAARNLLKVEAIEYDMAIRIGCGGSPSVAIFDEPRPGGDDAGIESVDT